MKRKFRIASVLLAVVLLMSVYLTPATASQGKSRGQERGQERQDANQIQYLDVGVKVVDGQPVLRYETEEGYKDTPFEIPPYAISADGQKVAVERLGDAILLPTGDGFEAVPLEDFCVVMVNGQIMLLAEVNPAWKLPVAVAKPILIALIAIVGGALTFELNQWWAGSCASPFCGNSDSDFGLFCGFSRCPATIHGFFIRGHWLRG